MSEVITEKGKALLKWQPNDKYRDEFDRIFKKGTNEAEVCDTSKVIVSTESNHDQGFQDRSS